MHICLVNLPRYEIHRPPLSLAILGEICNRHGIDWSCCDLSLDIWLDLPQHFTAIDDFCITKQIEPNVKQQLRTYIDTKVKEIVALHPDVVFCLSLLSVWSQPVCEMFCDSVKTISGSHILIGGQGLADQSWTEHMQETGKIDDFIVGEGELSFAAWLQGQRTGPGINNYDFQQIDDLDQHCVIPDYSRLPLEKYPSLGERLEFFITASRGCVRNCAYCDIGHQWKKYRYRSADHVAQEMIAQYERHGITDFFFTDSLINGSMKMLDELCDALIDYKQAHPDANFKFKGQYIFRPQGQVKERHIQRLKMAGLDYLIVGLETGSDQVRYDMNKKHTTQDAEWFLEMFKKYDISCHLLMITGWVTETLADHQATLDLFPKWQKYVASGTITGIELGSTLSILEHSPIGHAANDYDISMMDGKTYLWESASNPDLTIAERIRRRVETHEWAIKYRWPVTRGLYRLSTIKRHLLEAIEHRKNHPKKHRVIKIQSHSLDVGQS